MNYKVLLTLFILFILSNLPRLEKLIRGEDDKNKNCCDTRFSWQWPTIDYKDASITIYPNLINNYDTMYQGTTLLKNIKPNKDLSVCDVNGNFVRVKKGLEKNCCDSKLFWKTPFKSPQSVSIGGISTKLILENGKTISGGNYSFITKDKVNQN